MMPLKFDSNSDWFTELIKQSFRFLGQLSKPTRIITMMLLILIAFWFLSVYFIGKSFYDSNPIWITMLFCFIISVAWLIANTLLMALAIATLSPIFDQLGFDTSRDDDRMIVAAGLNSVVYLTIILFVSVYNNLAFSKFLFLCFCYPILPLIFFAIVFAVINIGAKNK